MSMMTTVVIVTSGRWRRGRGASWRGRRGRRRRRGGSWGRRRRAGIERDVPPPGAPIVCGSCVLLDGPQIAVVNRIDCDVAVVTPSIVAAAEVLEVWRLARLEHGIRPERIWWIVVHAD